MQCCEDINCFDQGRICAPETDLSRIVVVGGGFAGLNLIKKLKDLPVQVVLIDKNNFHQFLPLLYQVATSGIEPDNVVFPFRKLFKNYSNFIFRMAEAIRVDSDSNTLFTTIGAISYDYLVLACGSDTNFFGNESFEHFGTGLKTVTDALDIRSRLLQNLEKAAVTCITDEKKSLSSVVIVGGGATGVEIAGALAEFKKYILPKDYPELKGIEMKIYLIEAAGGLLLSMPEKLSQKAWKYLSDLKVDILLNTSVKLFDGSKVILDNGETLRTKNFIWTAGVKGVSVKGLPKESKNKQNRILVDVFSRIIPLDNVFAIGDNALLKTKQYPKGHPMVAQPAIQQGKLLAENLKRIIMKEPLISFTYNDKGSMATIGKKKAVARIYKLNFSGFFAWLIWSFIHLMSIIGVRNKVLIAVNWMWSYFTYDKGDRVIIRRYNEVFKEEEQSV
ncbi:MAG: NAD(P)/FAD-dependent oxidoreductase [Bacteroidetes bacterium]|nr:NAD(P)/FAD-dependent oxidoreductase [Bacteroidota bacterium]